MEAAYDGVRLWAQAVEEADRTSPAEVLQSLRRQTLDAPEGVVSIDPQTQHAWKVAQIGRITDAGQFEIVWSSNQPLRPIPYPIFRSRSEWDELVRSLFEGWGERWSNPSGRIEVIAEEATATPSPAETSGPLPSPTEPDHSSTAEPASEGDK